MGRTAIISVDGHVRAPRAGYREYIEQPYLDAYDEWVRSQEELGLPDAGNMQPAIGLDGQWDSDKRLRDLESQGVVAEVLFPNGLPFQSVRFEDAVKASDPGLDRQARRAYNRWLADFCAQAPGRRAGQALVSFDDIDEAVRDIHWAKEHGLGGIMMPALLPGGTYFFDPVLDPVWGACEETGLPISQHGGTGAPAYDPPGFAAIMTLAMEHSFYSGRSLWQIILGGVFDRFPDLHVVFVETEVDWIEDKIVKLDERMRKADEWMGFARHMNRERLMSRSASEYWASNCSAGISPFSIEQIPISGIVDREDDGFVIGTDRAMFGVDYPHFESIFPNTSDAVASLVDDPTVTDETARKILCGNAARIFGFDLDALAPDIERAGFEAVA
jgi:predicted TIM-barrel fold metal-dependent hydrolase